MAGQTSDNAAAKAASSVHGRTFSSCFFYAFAVRTALGPSVIMYGGRELVNICNTFDEQCNYFIICLFKIFVNSLQIQESKTLRYVKMVSNSWTFCVSRALQRICALSPTSWLVGSDNR